MMAIDVVAISFKGFKNKRLPFKLKTAFCNKNYLSYLIPVMNL
jgi:hypothetical protein